MQKNPVVKTKTSARPLGGVSDGFLKELGCTRDEFYNFVKLNPVGRAGSKVGKILQKLITATRGPGGAGASKRAFSCCGAYEIAAQQNNPEGAKHAFLSGLLTGYRFFIYYSVDGDGGATAALRDLGFRQNARFPNHNTGNAVRVLSLNTWNSADVD